LVTLWIEIEEGPFSFLWKWPFLIGGVTYSISSSFGEQLSVVSKKGKWHSMWLKAKITSLPEISKFVEEWLVSQERNKDDIEQRYLVELAVIEACTNIIRYAYPSSLDGKLGVSLRRSGRNIEILLLDEGIPFDPTTFCSPNLDAPREGGYGLFLIHKIMKEVRYQRKGSHWNLLYLISPLAE